MLGIQRESSAKGGAGGLGIAERGMEITGKEMGQSAARLPRERLASQRGPFLESALAPAPLRALE
jgi:hypothetical protein